MSVTNDDCPHLGAEYRPHLSPLLENPYPFYARARRNEPIFYSEALNMWVITRYEDIRTILLQPDIFSSKDALQPVTPFSREVIAVLQQGYPVMQNALSSDGERHKRLRNQLNKALSPARIAEMEPAIRAIAHKLIDGFIDDGRADFMTRFAFPLPLEVILTMIGMPQEQMGLAKKCCDDMVEMVGAPLTPERHVECARSYVTFQKYCVAILQDRTERPRQDIATDMITTQQAEEQTLNLPEMGVRLAGLVLAGHETTANLLGNAIRLLLTYREQWERLQAHPELVPQTVEETLRYEPPSQAFIRTATREAIVGGTTVPEGALLLLAYSSGNHDEAQFPDAERFDIARTSNRHLGFGHGIHFCVGAPLARLEGRIALEILTRRLPTLRLTPEQKYEYVPSMLTRGLKHLQVEWNPA